MKKIKIVYLEKAQKIRRLIVEAYAKMFEECDAVLSVAAPTIAPLIHESSNVRFGVSSFAEEHMQLQNFSGYPSITLPLGKVDSMPVAVNLTCKPFEEQKMFDVSSAIEECTGLKRTMCGGIGMNYFVTIGIEIHCELKTNTKMFSGAPLFVLEKRQIHVQALLI